MPYKSSYPSEPRRRVGEVFHRRQQRAGFPQKSPRLLMSMGPKQGTVVNALKFQVSENKASAAAPCPGCAGVFWVGMSFVREFVHLLA